MELKGKTALVFGAAGQVGSAVAKVFAREGASVHLSGPNLGAVENLAATLRADGANASAYKVDATADDEVLRHTDEVAASDTGIDIVFNAMGVGGAEIVAPSLDVGTDRFMHYLARMVPSQFLTARAAARHMVRQGRGVVVLLGATPSAGVAPFIAGASAAHAAIDGLARCLATEWSPSGVRVVCFRSAGMSDSRRIQSVLSSMADLAGAPLEVFLQGAQQKPLLRRMSTLAEAAEAIGFLASDRASTITGAIVNGSCGEVLD